MKSSLFFAAVLLIAVSSLFSCVSDLNNEKINDVNIEKKVGQFLNYVSAFNDLYDTGLPPDGDVADRVSLPTWLPKSNSIHLRVSNGVGYVFIQATQGVYSQVLKETENSSHFGLSDTAGINTPSGRLARPDFVPAGYVVYVR